MGLPCPKKIAGARSAIRFDHTTAGALSYRLARSLKRSILMRATRTGRATQMTTVLKTVRFLAIAAGLGATLVIVGTVAASPPPPTPSITITLTGQSMIRSDIRATAPATVPVIQGMLKGDVVFTNLEAAVAEKGETVQQGRGFLTPPEALDALTTFGFNLWALSGHHASDLNAT